MPGRRVGDSKISAGKAVGEYLLEYYARAGIEEVQVVLRPQKTDLVAHLLALDLDLDLHFVEIEHSRSVLETIAHAFPALGERRAALGFPDILLEPADVYRQLIERQEDSGADLVLALFPTDQDARSDMVELSPEGSVEGLVIKQPPRGLRYTWAAAVWTPRFTRFVETFLKASNLDDERRELHTSDAIQNAIDEGWQVDRVIFEHGRMLDVGTPQGLERALDRR